MRRVILSFLLVFLLTDASAYVGRDHIQNRIGYKQLKKILVMDQANAQRYCNMRVQTVEDCLKACIALAGKVKAKYFIIRLDGKGAFAYNGKYYYFVPNYDFVPEDLRGGQECYNAALLLRYLMEGDIRMACEFAAVAETVAMLRPGGVSNLPGYEDIKQFIIDNELDAKLLV